MTTFEPVTMIGKFGYWGRSVRDGILRGRNAVAIAVVRTHPQVDCSPVVGGGHSYRRCRLDGFFPAHLMLFQTHESDWHPSRLVHDLLHVGSREPHVDLYISSAVGRPSSWRPPMVPAKDFLNLDKRRMGSYDT